LRNSGKINFDFEVDLSPVVRKKSIRISPLIGHLRGNTRQRFNCHIIPSMPLKFKEEFLLQVAYFSPKTITVVGEGSYPSIWIDAPRVRNHQFFKYVSQARHIVLQKWLDDMLANLKRKKRPETITIDGSDYESEGESIYESSGSSEDEDGSKTLLKSRRDTTKMLEQVEVVDQDELD
jgi:hypothetical protein